MHVIKTLCCAAAITLLATSGAHADEWNKKTYLTFSGPVQIPGATLPAGTYLFQLADPDNARHVVMVASKDGSHVYGMFITIPNDRLETPDENVVMFGEAPAGAPQAVQAWWYPGDRMGEEFVYPKNQAVVIAKANHKEVLATESSVNAAGSESERMSALRGSKVARVDENGNMKGETTTANNAPAPTTTAAPATTTASTNTAESANKANRRESAAAATTTAPANTVNGRDVKSSRTARSNAANTTTVGTTGQANNTTANNARKTLPRTASSLELFELLSGLAIAAAFSMRQFRRALETR